MRLQHTPDIQCDPAISDGGCLTTYTTHTDQRSVGKNAEKVHTRSSRSSADDSSNECDALDHYCRLQEKMGGEGAQSVECGPILQSK